MERITDTFYNSGMDYPTFLSTITDEQRLQYNLYSKRAIKDFNSDVFFYIDLEYQTNLLVAGAGWCFDCKIYLPLLNQVAEHSPKINLRILNKDHFPFLVTRINNAEKIPQIIVYSAEYLYLNRWVERPTLAYNVSASVRRDLGWKVEKSVFFKEYKKRLLQNFKVIQEAFLQEIRAMILRADALQGSSSRYNE